MAQWKVLLVDDEVEFATTLAERLTLRGIEAVTVHDGEVALQRIAADPPQIVVLDMMMPGLGGLEVLRLIKKNHPGIPVILLTGRGSTKEGIDGMDLGAYDFLMKPIKIEALVEKMKEAVEQSMSAGSKHKSAQ
jgi:DNA-binding response OmpR family regulator